MRSRGGGQATLLAILLSLPRPAVAGESERWRCGDNEQSRLGELLLSNNVWNRGATVDYEQCVAVREEPAPAFLWRWRWPGGDLEPEAFPEIVFGWQPWHRESTTRALPRRLGSVRRLAAHYNAEVDAGGIHNLAFQLWMVSTPTVEPAAVRAEVMVWVANQGMQPAGKRIGALAGADGFELYGADREHDDRGVVRRWRLLTLVSDRPRLQGPLDLGLLLRALSAAGHLDPALWLANVDLGSEIAAGSGRATLRSYRIEIE